MNLTIRIPSDLLDPLLAAFYVGAEGADDLGETVPFDCADLASLRERIAQMNCSAKPGLPLLLELNSLAELRVLDCCFSVGADLGEGLTDDQYVSIRDLLTDRLTSVGCGA